MHFFVPGANLNIQLTPYRFRQVSSLRSTFFLGGKGFLLVIFSGTSGSTEAKADLTGMCAVQDDANFNFFALCVFIVICGKCKLDCTETEMFLDAFCRYLATHLGWQDSGPRPGWEALLDGFLVRAVNSDPSEQRLPGWRQNVPRTERCAVQDVTRF